MKLSLKALRINANVSVEEAARIADVTTNTIYRWENNQEIFRKASIEAIAKLVEAYGASMDNLEI